MTRSGLSFALALLAFAAPGGRLAILEDTVEVPAADWRAFDLELRQRPALIDCRFTVRSGGSGVRVAVLRREELARLRAGQGHHILAATGFERDGALRVGVPAGRYSLVIDNRLEGRGPARVWVQVSLVLAGSPPEARTISPQRRAVVIAASVLFFLTVVLFAGRKLQRALASRRAAPPPQFWV